jgi:Ribbon-helix-helix protein, copG family
VVPYTAVEKTTLYLPPDLKAAVKRVASERGISEAEVIRESLRSTVGHRRPAPRGGLFASGAPIARLADQHLAGFGER